MVKGCSHHLGGLSKLNDSAILFITSFSDYFICWFAAVESNPIQCKLQILMWNKFILFYNISISSESLRLHVACGNDFIYNSKQFYQKALVHQVEFFSNARGFAHFSFCKDPFRKDQFLFSLTIPLFLIFFSILNFFFNKIEGICSIFYRD